MKLSFTVEQFMEAFKNSNQSVFPMQVIFYLFGFQCNYPRGKEDCLFGQGNKFTAVFLLGVDGGRISLAKFYRYP